MRPRPAPPETSGVVAECGEARLWEHRGSREQGFSLREPGPTSDGTGYLLSPREERSIIYSGEAESIRDLMQSSEYPGGDERIDQEPGIEAAFVLAKRDNALLVTPLSSSPSKDEVLLLGKAIEEYLSRAPAPEEGEPVDLLTLSDEAAREYLEKRASDLPPGDKVFIDQGETISLEHNLDGTYQIDKYEDGQKAQAPTVVGSQKDAADVLYDELSASLDPQVPIPESEIPGEDYVLERAGTMALVSDGDNGYGYTPYFVREIVEPGTYPTNQRDMQDLHRGAERGKSYVEIIDNHSNPEDFEVEINFYQGGKRVSQEQYSMNPEEASLVASAIAQIKENRARRAS